MKPSSDNFRFHEPTLGNINRQILNTDPELPLSKVIADNLKNDNDPNSYLYTPKDPLWSMRYRMSPLEAKTLDLEWAKKNPELTALSYPSYSLDRLGRRENSFANTFASNVFKPYIVNPLLKGLNFTTQFGPLGSAVATGGAGYVGGKIVDSILNRAGLPSRFDLLLGLLGTGAGYLMGSNKSSSHKLFNMKKNSAFYKFGQAIGFAKQNVPVGDGVALSTKNEVLSDVTCEGYGVMQKNVCKLAADMYAFTGKKNKLEYHVFNKIAHAKKWSHVLDSYVDTFYETLINLQDKNKLDLNEPIKSANSLLNLFTFAATRGAALTPEAIKTILGLSAVTGGSLGAAAWLANRHATEDRTKNEELKQKINYYNMVTDELSNQLKAKGLIVQEEDPELKSKQLV